MHAAYVLVAFVSIGAPGAGDLPKEPGVYWEQTVEMRMGGHSMPAQTTKVCLPKKQDWTQPPQQGEGDGDCKLTDVKRAGKKMTWKVVCANGMGGDGEMTWSGETYAGTSNLRTPMGEMKMNMKGRKVGGDCDANELEREMAAMEAGARAQQAEADEAVAAACDEAVGNMDPMTIATLPQCREKRGAFCKRLETREGLTLLAAQGEPAQGEAAKLCGKDLGKVRAALCPAAAKDHAKGGARAGEALLFIAGNCPAQARPIAQRECAGRSYTDLEGAMREFCTAFARSALDEGAPAVPPARATPERTPPPDEVEQGKKILKGLLGR